MARPSTRTVVLSLWVVGAVLGSFGLVGAVAVGPEGRVSIERRLAGSGVLVLEDRVLAATTVPLRVQASAPGKAPEICVGMADDIASLVGTARHQRIPEVQGPFIRGLTVHSSGVERPDRMTNRDLCQLSASGSDGLEIPVVDGRRKALVLSDPDTELDLTLTWSSAAWFWQFVLLCGIGLALLASAWQIAGWSPCRSIVATLRRRVRPAWVGPERVESEPVQRPMPAGAVEER